MESFFTRAEVTVVEEWRKECDLEDKEMADNRRNRTRESVQGRKTYDASQKPRESGLIMYNH